jgi:hypothetical protein
VRGNPVVSGDDGDKISVLYDGVPVGRVTRTWIRIQNVGHASVRSEDVRSPIEVKYSGNVLSIRKVRARFAHIRPVVERQSELSPSLDPTRLVLGFSHLEPGDSFSFEVLHDGSDATSVAVSADIVGLPNGVEANVPTWRDRVGQTGNALIGAGLAGLIGGAVVGLTYLDPDAIPDGIIWAFYSLCYVLGATGGLAYGARRDRQARHEVDSEIETSGELPAA